MLRAANSQAVILPTKYNGLHYARDGYVQFMQLFIENNGTIRCLYDGAIDLSSLGQLQIVRGSQEEPDGRH